MFTQFRQAVENLAPQPQRRSSDAGGEHPPPASRSPSLDSHARPSSPLTSSQLAESALANLRKSLATQRSGSPGLTPRNAGVTSPRENRPAKSTLEDRLRATFAIGDASNTTSPDVSARVTPSPSSAVKHHPLSPYSTPLPESPALSPRTEADLPTLSSIAPPLDDPVQDSPPIESPESVFKKPTEGSDPLAIGLPGNIDIGQDASGDTFAVPDGSPNVEELQRRLKQVEQRFTDVSTSFKRLQAEKAAADSILRELTPLESMQDGAALRDYLQNTGSKTEIFQDEIKRLNGKLERQEDRIGELRDTHRLESASQSDQIEKLRTQLNEAEALVKATQITDTQAEEAAAKHKVDVDRLVVEAERAKQLAKEEEEKRVKAISLLKTVRQKLVKAEKEKDDAVRETLSLRERDREGRDREQAERARLQHEVEVVNIERENAVAGLKAQFDKEVANVKDRLEKEASALKGQFELEGVTTKNAHAMELASKNTHISSLEKSLNNLTNDKNSFFDQLQLRQAELESAQSHLGSLQSQNMEFQYQLREANDRYALLKENFAEIQHEQDSRSRELATSTGEVARLLAATEAKYESKMFDLKRNLNLLEKERNDGEAEWSRKLRDKIREAEDSKRLLGAATRSREDDEEMVVKLKAELARLQGEHRLQQQQLSELHLSNLKVKDSEKASKAQELELSTKVSVLERQVEETKSRETQLRHSNKTLRDELRKVQSSAALLERQRNPGVGYWTSRTTDNNSPDTRTSTSSASSDSHYRVGSPVPSSKDDEEINLEYLRNVILQFLEHKEMRPNLVKVLSIILRFTPQETRRLIAKV